MKTILCLCLSLLLSFNTKAQELYFPPLVGTTWETTAPQELGWCDSQVDVLYDFLESENTKSFLILKDGKIVLERYFGNYTKDSLWFWFSAGKSLTAVLTGIAQEQGLLNINDRTSQYLGSGWTSLTTEQEDQITIEDQLTMTSGLNEQDFACTNPECLIYLTDPDTRWVYHNAPYSLLRNVLESATGEDITDFTRTSVTNKTGMAGSWISSGFNNFFVSRARDMARFGLLVLNDGFWDTTPVLSDQTFVQSMTQSSQQLNPSYGYLWWLNGQASHIAPSSPQVINGPIAPAAPSDVYTAAGAQGQYISISPERKLIMIRQGTSGDDDKAALTLLNEIWARIEQLDCTVTGLDASVQSGKPVLYPNPATTSIHLADVPVLDTTAMVFDVNGKNYHIPVNNGQLSIESLPPGLYQLKLNEGSNIKWMKFVKQ